MNYTSITPQRVILIGRHAGEVPNVTIVAQVNQEWSLNRDECLKQLADLERRARESDCALLFQNIPGILAAAMIHFQKLAAEEFLRPGRCKRA